jgi:hypothetical protein
MLTTGFKIGALRFNVGTALRLPKVFAPGPSVGWMRSRLRYCRITALSVVDSCW